MAPLQPSIPIITTTASQGSREGEQSRVGSAPISHMPGLMRGAPSDPRDTALCKLGDLRIRVAELTQYCHTAAT